MKEIMNERKIDMRNVMMILVLGALMVCLVPANAQYTLDAQGRQEWQSTSAMQGAGSAFVPQLTDVGATQAYELATTTESSGAARKPGAGIRKDSDPWADTPEGGEQDEGSPIGDAMWPLMLLVGAYCGVMIFRRKRALRE